MTSSLDTPGVATFGTTSTRQFVGCRVCGRTLLLGERSVGFFTQAGAGPFDVCELCVPRAHRYGLRPRPSSPDEVAHARRGSIVRRVRSLIASKRSAARPAAPPRRRAKKPVAPIALGAAPVGSAAIPVALAAFNQSEHARTLAGLHRTLGEPRSSVAPRSATDREVILTVAWEIVWYQFRIMPDGIEQQRGQYVSELPPRWQQWNCRVCADGTIRDTDAPPTAIGQDDASKLPVEGLVR